MNRYDRTTGDVGNIMSLEHVNLTVPSQNTALSFYCRALGLTRDPIIDFGTHNLWINAGDEQFHLPTGPAQIIRGVIGLVVPDLAQLAERLTRAKKGLADTKFAFKVHVNHIMVTCPWGNRIRCHSPAGFNGMSLGIPYIELDVANDTAKSISDFYSRVFKAPVIERKAACSIQIGTRQTITFKESRREQKPYDGHHIAIYLADFSGPHTQLEKMNLITEESDANQYRFEMICNRKGKPVYQIEHEVRSLHHPLHGRSLVNRNANQSFFNYRKGFDFHS